MPNVNIFLASGRSVGLEILAFLRNTTSSQGLLQCGLGHLVSQSALRSSVDPLSVGLMSPILNTSTVLFPVSQYLLSNVQSVGMGLGALGAVWACVGLPV